MTRPYIGVSGVMTSDEAREVARLYREAWMEAGREPTHALMIGVLASAKTLAGGTNKYPRRYPRVEDIAGIFQKGPVLNLVHFASDRPPSSDVLFKVAEAGGADCHGWQFNVAWPDPVDLLNLRGHYPGRRAVLQAGPKMLAEMGAAASLAWKLKPYASIATDVLIDASGGMGLPIDAAAAAWPICFVADQCPGMGAGIAGGFCAETLDEAVGKMLRAGCSIDAEGRLRDDADGGGNLDMAKVSAYLRAAVRLAAGTP